MIRAVALLLLGSGTDGLPTRLDVDFARTARIHECIGDDGMVHCRRFENLRCAFVNNDRTLARCSYREWSETRPWPRKQVTLRRDGEDWRWVAGDEPRCSIMLITEN